MTDEILSKSLPNTLSGAHNTLLAMLNNHDKPIAESIELDGLNGFVVAGLTKYPLTVIVIQNLLPAAVIPVAEATTDVAKNK